MDCRNKQFPPSSTAPQRLGTKTFLCSSLPGFTLIELIIVIVIVGILSALGGLLIINQIESYVGMSRRAQLVDEAESALRRMQRDIRAAVPNSIEIDDNNKSVTFLHTVGGGRYRTKCPSSMSNCPHNQTLEFNQTDNKFSIIGRLLEDSMQKLENGTLVIYNTGYPPADAYSANNNTAKIIGVDYDQGLQDSSNFTISRNEKFFVSSPYKRFQIIDKEVCYAQKGRNLFRYESQNITDPNSISCDELGEGALLAKHVKNAIFNYYPGSYTRSGLLTLELTLSDEGETISLLHQVHVLNCP